MTTEQVRKAIDRVRRYQRDENPADIWEDVEHGRHRDYWRIVTAYLADHPADDAEPITENRLERAGFFSVGDDVASCMALPVGEAGVWLDPEPAGWRVSFDAGGECKWPHVITTMGELRRIALAYGAPLTEAAQ